MLALGARLTHAGAMFAVTEAGAAAILTAFHDEGELWLRLSCAGSFGGHDNGAAHARPRSSVSLPTGLVTLIASNQTRIRSLGQRSCARVSVQATWHKTWHVCVRSTRHVRTARP